MSKEPTITYHDFVNAMGDPVYAFKVHCSTSAEREARVAMERHMPVAEAYMPEEGKKEPKLGIPFDPPEFFTTPPPCDGNQSAAAYIANAQLEDALQGEGDGCGVGLCVKRDEA